MASSGVKAFAATAVLFRVIHILTNAHCTEGKIFRENADRPQMKNTKILHFIVEIDYVNLS